jgi:hypothetical protein
MLELNFWSKLLRNSPIEGNAFGDANNWVFVLLEMHGVNCSC